MRECGFIGTQGEKRLKWFKRDKSMSEKVDGKVKAIIGFRNYAWFVLFYNLLVIMWGAYVRATGSGAGCGAHWPLCNGEVIPRAPAVETLVEFTHRLSSGLVIILVAYLIYRAFRLYPKGHLMRKAVTAVGFFTVTEALVGAGLVLFELVAGNESIARALAMIVHLINTFFLLAALSMTAWWATKDQTGPFARIRGLIWLLPLGMAAFLFLGASGAVTALGDTLYPASSLAEGLRQDMSPTASILLRLRIFHPVIAVIVSLYSVAVLLWVRDRSKDGTTRRLALFTIVTVAFQIGLGVVNVLLLAPVAIQMVHLLISDLIWIGLILTTVNVLADPALAQRLGDQKIHDWINEIANQRAEAVK
jgi:heme A synthase